MANTPNLLLQNPTPGDPSTTGVWGTIENTGRTLVDDAVAGIQTLSIAGSGTTILTSTAGAADQARHQHFEFTGILTGASTVLYPQGLSRMFSITNSTTGAYSLTIGANDGGGSAAGSTVVVPQGGTMLLLSDGVDIVQRISSVDLGYSLGSALDMGLTNSNSGAAASAGLLASNGSASAFLRMHSTGFTTSGQNRQNGALLYTTGTGGLSFGVPSDAYRWFVAGVQYGSLTSSGFNVVSTAGNTAILSPKITSGSVASSNYDIGAASEFLGYQIQLVWNAGDGFAVCFINSISQVISIGSSQGVGGNNQFDTTNNTSSNSGEGIALIVSGGRVYVQTKTNYTGTTVAIHRYGGT